MSILTLINMKQKSVVFTPLRVALIILMTLANLAAVVALLMPQQPWADILGLFAIVFVMMFVFVILLEYTWLHHRGKMYSDPAVQKQYRLAKIIYLVLLVTGILIGVVVLL